MHTAPATSADARQAEVTQTTRGYQVGPVFLAIYLLRVSFFDMALPSYFMSIEDYRDKSLEQFADILRGCVKKSLGEVRLSELCAMPDHPHGVYFMFDSSDQLWYVGKATSRSFIGRISSHLDQRQDAWFNTLPRLIHRRYQSTGATYAHALAKALSLNLVMFGVRSTDGATRLELDLQRYLRPALNPKQGVIDETILLGSYET